MKIVQILKGDGESEGGGRCGGHRGSEREKPARPYHNCSPARAFSPRPRRGKYARFLVMLLLRFGKQWGNGFVSKTARRRTQVDIQTPERAHEA